ncbi:hypothetical protein [Cellulomonas sp. Root137]|uniref:hypothetical protein n=1 Tax=Cellulomonas sp. Root137 TaxID=1736459 RepID=UPI0006F3FF6F|nr:hypothetical protein [Cellulomonas sp. Root137]KQY42857.1 hypothetical protein ASD18_17885 [Cellulomonas sp. Root137]
MSSTAENTARGVVRTRTYRAVAVAYWTLFALVCVGGMIDPGPAAQPGFPPIGALLAAVSIVAAVRAARMGVAVADSHAVVRNLLSTRRIALADIDDVRVRNYDGLIVRNSPTSWLRTVALTTKAGTVVKAYGLVGFDPSVSRAAARLQELIGLPRGTRPPQHRV